MAEKIRIISHDDLAEFNQKANELNEAGYEMDHEIRVVPTGVSFLYTAIFRKYPQHETTAIAEFDPVQERETPTPYDDDINDTIYYLKEAEVGEVKRERANRLKKLLEERQNWRYCMRENRDIQERLNG